MFPGSITYQHVYLYLLFLIIIITNGDYSEKYFTWDGDRR